MTPLETSNAHVYTRCKHIFDHLGGMQDSEGYMYVNGCQSRLLNPLEVPLDKLDEPSASEWNGAAFDFYLHNGDYSLCCSQSTVIARSIYAATLPSEDVNTASYVVRSVQLGHSDNHLVAATARQTTEFTYVPERRTTRFDTRVSNTVTIFSLAELDKVLEEFLSLISLGFGHAPPP